MKSMKKSFLLCLMALAACVCLIFAACKEKSIKFSFELNGGNAIESVEVAAGENYTLPTPEKEGSSFEGWYLSADFSGQKVETVVAENDTTFYAKWEQMYLVTLALDGGTLNTGKVYLKEGAGVQEAVKDLVPTKTGYQFDAWYVGTQPLSANTKMTSAGITLTAHYKVSYTVEAYLQTLDGTGYEKGENIVGYGNVGEKPDVKLNGFVVVPHDGDVRDKVLTDNPSENSYVMYFDREECTLTLVANLPTENGDECNVKSFVYPYGSEIELPSDTFVLEGYCLEGWATSVKGKIAYKSGRVEKNLFNADGEWKPELLKIEQDSITLFAVWNKAYVDLFDSEDYIYVFESEPEAVYLERSGVFFKGEYEKNKSNFLFKDGDGKILLEGVLHTYGTYTYYSLAREGYATLYDLSSGIVETTKAFFDAYNGIKYSVADAEGHTKTSEGTYYLNDEGFYSATFTSGELSGQSMIFILGTVRVDNVARSVFQVRNEKEYNMGELVRFALNDKNELTYYLEVYKLTLNGFGVASVFNGQGYENYYYLVDGDLLGLFDGDNNLVGMYKFMNGLGKAGYIPYAGAFDKTYTSESGATLQLDGIYNATYTNGATVLTGVYYTRPSAFGGKIIDFITKEKEYTFRVKTTEEEVDGTKVTINSFTQLAEGYREFYFKDEDPKTAYYYAPLVVLNETEDGGLTVYGYTSSRTYEKLADGKYVVGADGFYCATIENHYEANVMESPIDVATVKTFVFDVTSIFNRGEYYDIAYWYSITTDEGTTRYDKAYTEVGGDGTLTVVATFAIYRKGDSVFFGTFNVKENVMNLVGRYNNQSFSLYFELNDEDGTFISLNSMLGAALALTESGEADRTQQLYFDGKGGVTYTVMGESEDDVKTYEGIFEISGKTVFDSNIFVFRSEELTFEFVLVVTDNGAFFSRYNDVYNGKYTNTLDGSQLTLDGYSYIASYYTKGTEVLGVYYLFEKDCICFLNEDGYAYYFDVADDRSFTKRSGEYGSYLVFNNLEIENGRILLDGYGKLTVFTDEMGSDGKVNRVVIGEGTYRITEDGLVELQYEGESGKWTRLGSLGTITMSSGTYRAFFILHEEVVHYYVNEADWSVMELDGYGNAVKYTTLGTVEYGKYVIITESLFYYFNDDNTDAAIFIFDNDKSTAKPLTLDPIGYYTEDLESLLFTNYGFMIMGGETRYYYKVVDETVFIYHFDENDPNANEYGFVEENFGKFESTKTWNGKTYYQNSGYALMFKRAEEGKNLYPVLMRTNNGDEKFALEDITFTPSGGTEFNVAGSVTINGKNYRCSVTRTVGEDGTVEMYLSLGNLRFDISLSYKGENPDGSTSNTYSISNMRMMLLLPSNAYLATNLMSIVFAGKPIANSFGVIQVTDCYNEEGDLIENGRTVNGAFGPSSKVLDSKGNLMSIENAPYTITRNGLYVVEFTAADGYVYHMAFKVLDEYAQFFECYSYEIEYLSRVETMEMEDGYSLKIERVILSESKNYNVGTMLFVELYKDGETLTVDFAYTNQEKFCCVIRAKDAEGKPLYTSATYYTIELTQNTSGSLGGDGEETYTPELPTYKSATLISVRTATTIGNNAAHVDVFMDGEKPEATLIFIGNGVYRAETTEVNEDGTYLITTASGLKFLVDPEKGTIAKV